MIACLHVFVYVTWAGELHHTWEYKIKFILNKLKVLCYVIL